MVPTSEARKLPLGLKPANRVVVALQRLGLAFGQMRLLSVPGRKSGRMQTTPVSPLTVDGRRYLIAVFDGADWVKNVRAAGWGILARGRKQERVVLEEMSVEERASVLRNLPDKEPQGARFLRQRYRVSNDPEAFAALAPRCAMFRVEGGRRMASADPVIVVHYDEAWPSLFEEERKRIEGAIGPWAEGIEHVGSTAVPGLAAKPVIDIMVGVKSLDDSPILVERLVGIGYEYVPQFERDLPFRRYFRKMREGPRTHQIHLVERSNTDWWEPHLFFRDYLRTHPETAREYGRLKYHLAERFRGDRHAYTDAKTDFISEVVRRATLDKHG
jgi:GrpB-like predicted nucleotidyltransferase (UPF0157 family)